MANQLVPLFVFGVVLMASLAVCLWVFLDLLRQGYRWLTLVCPHCARRRLRRVADVRQPAPGSLYVCTACSRRWFLPDSLGGEWQEASGPELNSFFEPPAPPRQGAAGEQRPATPRARTVGLRNPASKAKHRLIRLLELAASYNDKGIYWRNDSPAQVQQTRQGWQQEIDILLAEVGESSLPAELLAALRSGVAVCDDSGRFVEQARRWMPAGQSPPSSPPG